MTAQPQGVLLSARLEKIRDKARLLRIHSLRATSAAGSGHPTSCLSAAELVAATFFHAMKFDPANPNSLSSDRFVLSKGHAAPVLYAALAEAGVFPVSRLLTLRQFGSELEGHPTPLVPGVDAATGSLGQGLSVGARSEEHTSELQSQSNLVCRLLLEKKKKKKVSQTDCEICCH